MNHHPIGPGWVGLAWAGVPLVVAGGLLACLRLGQGVALLVATARLVGQMMLLAVVLGGIVRGGVAGPGRRRGAGDAGGRGADGGDAAPLEAPGGGGSAWKRAGRSWWARRW